MKKVKLMVVLAATTLIAMTACEDTMNPIPATIDGTYVGQISTGNGLNDAGLNNSSSFEATAEVMDLGNGQMEVHCFGGMLDTTFVLNYFEHHDSMMVCLDSMAFEGMYGHTMGHGGMMGSDSSMCNGNGGMMGNDSTMGNGNGGMNGNGNGGMMGNGNGGMMGSGNGGTTAWTNHMNDEHNTGDVHFGGFDMTNHSFDYTMKRIAGDYHFRGAKVE